MAKFKNPIKGENLNKIRVNTDFELTQKEEEKRHTQLMGVLGEIVRQLDKFNTYMALITDKRL